MLISCNWLGDFVDLPTDVDRRWLAERLTITTAEVEGVEHVTSLPQEVVLSPGERLEKGVLDDWIIEIDNKSITHRPDLWGHYGVAREVAAILDRPLKPLDVVNAAELCAAGLPEIPIVIDDERKCPRYSGLRMTVGGAGTSAGGAGASAGGGGLGSLRSAGWMQVRLARVGMRPISLLVDLTNYVMAELGQPMHAFDAATVDRIEVAAAAGGERFRTLDNVERVLPAGTLMIQRGRRNVAVAGIMGGLETEVTERTREILLESANFDAATIRRGAQGLGLRTEASARFEKSLDPTLTVTAIGRFVRLARAQGAEVRPTSRLSDSYPSPLEVRPIALDARRVSALIGQEVSSAQVASILGRLGFDVKEAGGALRVTPPTYRSTKDISIEADLVEEVARFVGYDHITPELPRVTARPLAAAADHVVERRTVELLCRDGAFIEIHGYLWDDEDWLARIGPGEGAAGRIGLRNPVSPQQSRLRTSLLPGLYAACERNRHRLGSFGLMEIGTAVAAAGRIQGGDAVSRQSRRLGIAVVRSGRGAEDEAWGALKATAETWGQQVARMAVSYAACEERLAWEDPTRVCLVQLDDVVHGRAGLVSMESRLRVDERMRSLAIGLMEIDLTGVDPDGRATEKLPPPPTYPEVTADFSFVADARRQFAQIAADLRAFSHPLLLRLHYVGSYDGEGVGVGRRSLTVRAVIGDAKRTLSEADLSAFRAAFTAYLERLGLELRSAGEAGRGGRPG